MALIKGMREREEARLKMKAEREERQRKREQEKLVITDFFTVFVITCVPIHICHQYIHQS